MAYNTDKEHSANPANIQSENHSYGIIPVKDAETISLNQETAILEVYDHPELHHKPKKWKEYFLEFQIRRLASSQVL